MDFGLPVVYSRGTVWGPITIASKRGSDSSPLPALLTGACVVAGLYFGRDVFVPISLALLLSFLLTYPVTWLENLRLGRVPAVMIVLTLAFSTAGALLWMGTEQLSAIVVRLPDYQHNIQRKLEGLRNPGSFGMARAVGNLKQMVIGLSPNTAASAANLQRERQVHPHSPVAKLVGPTDCEVRTDSGRGG